MKRLELLLICVILTNLFACGPTVTFSEPQPAGVRNLLKFPKRLQGEYLNVSDNSTLIVNDSVIQLIYDYDYTFHINQLDSSDHLSGDTIINNITNEKILIRREGDSLITHVHDIDTLFQMHEFSVARKFRGYYFINNQYGDNKLGGKKIQLTKGGIVISSISNELDIKNLEELTEVDSRYFGFIHLN
ncbi:MAG: hypothetical protein IPJ06_00680 [Saprospiraceae bacterium]|nr:hypothetical protein [Saprospiraceae bacterium]